LQLVQDALESQKKVMLLAENEKQLKAQVSLFSGFAYSSLVLIFA